MALKDHIEQRLMLGKFHEIMDVPNLLAVQRESFEAFLQRNVLPEERKDVGLQAVFRSAFPIYDLSEDSYLEFVSYSLGDPKYAPDSCRERGLTYAAPLKTTLRLVVRERDKIGERPTSTRTVKEIKEQEVFLCELPLMTENGTFIINGAERVVVSQLHRSPGLVFEEDEERSLQSGKRMYVARMIPYRGIWLEFEFDLNNLMHARIDRRKKVLASTLLRAMGYVTDEEILKLFYSTEEISLEELQRLKGRITAAPIVDPGTGEVLAESNSKILDIDEEKGEIVVRVEEGESRTGAGTYRKMKVRERDRDKDIHCRSIAVRGKVESIKAIILDHPEDGFSICDSIRADRSRTEDGALHELHQKLSPTSPATPASTHALLENLFFNSRKYDLAAVGRYKLNRKLGRSNNDGPHTLTREDIAETMKALLKLCNGGEGSKDDIDHLGNRRVRSIGELLENQFRIGFARVEKVARASMGLVDLQNVLPNVLLNTKPLSAAIKSFFASSQLCQFMDQTNPLSEITHKRRLSALGPGGLSRERAGFEVRDVHHSHYGRVCPIETPEGPNIGLISSLATYARINELGFLESPYRKVSAGKAADETVYLSADQEDQYVIAQANTQLDDKGKIVDHQVLARFHGDISVVSPEAVDFMDVSPKQLVSVATALIPFLEHDDANRALMGANMQRQAVPLVKPEPALIGTGMESIIARDSGQAVLARRAGLVAAVDARRIIIYADAAKDPSGKISDPGGVDVYKLTKYRRSNQSTCLNQKPLVAKGERVKAGQAIADGPAMKAGELTLGVNVLCAFMPWRGHNFEDAVLISERLLKEDALSSVHIEEFEAEACETKLGPEEITRDVPNVSEEALRNIDEDGVARIGAEVQPGDILVSRVAPKGDTEQTPEEKLLRAIFGEKAEDVRDTSLRVPPGVDGKILSTRIFARKNRDERLRSKDLAEVKRLETEKAERVAACRRRFEEEMKQVSPEIRVRTKQLMAEEIEAIEKEVNEEIERIKKGDELLQNVLKLAKVYVAKKRRLQVGDKVAGRHGNKGVVAKILPEEDMPFLPDGTPVDMILNPLGVPSRMNVGQIYEIHMGWAAQKLGHDVSCPVFDGASEEEIKEWLKKADLPEDGKIMLYDGRSGEPFEQKVTVGNLYMMKLTHLVETKIHARSTGPYSLVTQQPLGGKAQFGGQRFGEMEVWALEAYGAAHALQELLTVKSDDVSGRAKVYEALVKGQNVPQSGMPESFNVLLKELQSLGLNVELLREIKRGGREGKEEKEGKEESGLTGEQEQVLKELREVAKQEKQEVK